jgi:catechol 2,3-dioxygenase-like lactoylglutathione lyase family enzyme
MPLGFRNMPETSYRSVPEREIMTNLNVETPTLQHVTITYPPGQQKSLRSFYIDILGLREKPVPRVVAPLGWVWFDTGAPGVELHTIPSDEAVGPDTVHHFCLEVKDLEGLRARLEDHGIAIKEARPLPWRPRFFVRDPFRNLVEVVRVEGDYIAAGD